jgi:hypothetical protein
MVTGMAAGMKMTVFWVPVGKTTALCTVLCDLCASVPKLITTYTFYENEVFTALILTFQVHRCLEEGAVGVMLFADPEQYPDSEKRNKPFLLPSQLGMLQNMHGNPATEGTSKLLQILEFLNSSFSYSASLIYHIILYNYGQTTWCMSDHYGWLVTVAMDVLATPC